VCHYAQIITQHRGGSRENSRGWSYFFFLSLGLTKNNLPFAARALVTMPVDKARQDIIATHDKSKKTFCCLALSQHDSERARAIGAARLML
jgi:hypothetical protein